MADTASYVYAWELEKRNAEIDAAHARAITRLTAKTVRRKANALAEVQQISKAVARAIAKASAAPPPTAMKAMKATPPKAMKAMKATAPKVMKAMKATPMNVV